MKIGTAKTLLIAGTTAILLSGSAFAGQKTSGPTVSIYGGGLRANGSLGAVRNSSNTVEYIGCKVTATSSGSLSALCSAQDSTGLQFSCSTSVAAMVNVALTLSGDSSLALIRDGAGTCTSISIENSSTYVPKAP